MRDIKMQEKRQKLLECALTLFSEKGYINTPVREIIDMSGYGTGTFYKYFNNKEDILKILLEDLFEQIVDSVNDYFAHESDLYKRFVETKRVIIEVYARNEKLSDIYSRVAGMNDNIDQCLKDFDDKFLDFTSKNIEYGIKNGSFRTLPILPIAHATLAIIKYAVYKWVVAKEISKEEMVDLVISFMQCLSIGLVKKKLLENNLLLEQYGEAFIEERS
ncbi:MAG: TetR/AcrR family transcriptional regulator [Syntrophomonadaceae bacterium]|nr:TetR/AcrR family transcriptional regulator [Syntrophomonadaceae bacterium]